MSKLPDNHAKMTQFFEQNIGSCRDNRLNNSEI